MNNILYKDRDPWKGTAVKRVEYYWVDNETNKLIPNRLGGLIFKILPSLTQFKNEWEQTTVLTITDLVSFTSYLCTAYLFNRLPHSIRNNVTQSTSR